MFLPYIGILSQFSSYCIFVGTESQLLIAHNESRILLPLLACTYSVKFFNRTTN